MVRTHIEEGWVEDFHARRGWTQASSHGIPHHKAGVRFVRVQVYVSIACLENSGALVALHDRALLPEQPRGVARRSVPMPDFTNGAQSNEKVSEEAEALGMLKGMCRSGEGLVECLRRLIQDSVKMAG